jgi:hypothetical protein
VGENFGDKLILDEAENREDGSKSRVSENLRDDANFEEGDNPEDRLKL